MEIDEFLSLVITAKEGWFCLAIGAAGSSGWVERWYRWPAQKQDILDAIARTRGENNVYFSTYLFSMGSSLKSNVLPSFTIQADLDEADVDRLPIRPTVLVRTSPGRHQAYWVLQSTYVDPTSQGRTPIEPLDPKIHEMLSRKLTYAINKCDRSGWPLGRKVRVPNTFNFKYETPKPVEVVDASMRHYSVAEFELLPEPAAPNGATGNEDDQWLESLESIEFDVGPHTLLESIKAKIPPAVYVQYNSAASNRSNALWALLLSSFNAGLGRDQVFWLAKHSPNNKFADLRHNALRELGKDVLRAEAVVRSASSDPREVVNQTRRMNPSIVRKQTMLQQVLTFMRERGSFYHTSLDNIWYIRKDIGRPIRISPASEYLDTLVDIEYGLNKTESEHAYIVAGLCSYARSLEYNCEESTLSYYDQESGSLLLHNGHRDVYRITSHSIDTVVNGSYGVLFPWVVGSESFKLGEPDHEWGEHLFGQSASGDALSNLIGMDRDAGLALLECWMVFVLMKSMAPSRPILATFGQPGSGKSTLFKKVYRLIYGRYRAVTGVTNPDEFDQATVHDPLVAFDNVDSWEKWLPDRIAQSAGISDVTRRKLYTDGDKYLMRRKAMLGITAHNPKFGREDVADRLLLLTFARLEDWLPEQLILDRVTELRPALWAGICADVQKVLATPMPARGPQFRIEDFARIGMWIASAINKAEPFERALKQIRYGQRSYSLEEDAILVFTLQALLERKPEGIINKTPGQLWGLMEAVAGSESATFVKTYRSSTSLGKKLLALQDALRLVFNIQWHYNSAVGTKLWTILPKGEDDAEGDASSSSNGLSGAEPSHETD